MDQRVADAWDLVATAGADPVEVVAATEIVIAHLHARQLAALEDLHEDLPACEPIPGDYVDPAPAEVATAMRWSTGQAGRRMDTAIDLHDQLPDVLEALRCGWIDLAVASEIAAGTGGLHPIIRAKLANEALDYAQTHTRAQLRHWLATRLAALDPELAEARHRRRAQRERGVWVTPDADGMAMLKACLTAEEAQACLAAISAKANATDGHIDANRADTLVALCTGTELGAPIPVQVIVTPNGPELAGHGPLSPRHAARLMTTGVLIDLRRPKPRMSYAPGIAITRWVRARDRHCRFPGCRRPASVCDLDHLTPYPAGPTDASNLACLCRTHHRLKTFTGWKVRALTAGALEWTSPQGRVYTTYLNDP